MQEFGPETTEHICPEEVIIKAALEGLEHFNSIHPSTDRAIGALGAANFFLQSVREKIPCSGPTYDSDGLIVCPLRGVLQTARNAVISPWLPNNFIIRLEEVDENGDPIVSQQGNTGQYL